MNREISGDDPDCSLHFWNPDSFDCWVGAIAAFLNEGRQHITQKNEISITTFYKSSFILLIFFLLLCFIVFFFPYLFCLDFTQKIWLKTVKSLKKTVVSNILTHLHQFIYRRYDRQNLHFMTYSLETYFDALYVSYFIYLKG